MFTQVITPYEKQVIIDIPDAYLGHRLSVTVTELDGDDAKRYSLEVDLSNFKFNREEANER